MDSDGVHLCGVCCGEVLPGALRCRHCGTPFEGSEAGERLELGVRGARDRQLGLERTGVEFGLFPEDDVDG